MGFLAKTAPASRTDLLPAATGGAEQRTANALLHEQGPAALATAIRQCLAARQHQDLGATGFWCAVCASVVRLRQAEA